MDWGDAPAWGALLLSAGAIVVSLKARDDGKRAADAAENSASDGRRSADAAVRGVEIANASLQLQLEALKPQVVLRIEAPGRGVLRLINRGDAPAVGLALSEEDAANVHWDEPLGDVLEPQDGREFQVANAADPIRRLRFTWDGQEGPVAVPLP